MNNTPRWTQVRAKKYEAYNTTNGTYLATVYRSGARWRAADDGGALFEGRRFPSLRTAQIAVAQDATRAYEDDEDDDEEDA